MTESSNFIFNEIDKDLSEGVYTIDELCTRFPPEPNGYLHIGHAKAICINFSVKEKYKAKTNLRFDDTNPSKEDTEYTNAIKRDIEWLGFKWDNLCYASDYFDKMYDYALELIRKGLAYVDDQTAEQIKQNRGTLTQKGIPSPYRERSIDENLELFENMKNGLYEAGSKVLRAKIDMASPNINMRDPVLYRILNEKHHRTADKWVIYPMYDYAHPIEDAIEGVTHSLCSLEFEDHRPFYNWLLDNLDDYKKKRPRQIEFARLNLSRTVMSKRYLKQLIDEGITTGWDDPRMPTLSGLRRRGVTPMAIRNFCAESGVAKSNSVIDKAQFEYFIREDLMNTAVRVMAVLDPLKLTIVNYPEGKTEILDIPYRMDDENSATRKVVFSRSLYIERSDFEEEPPKKFFRLYPGNEVRLMGAYFVKCIDYIKDENGRITEVLCTYDPKTKSGSGFNERKVKGTIHWVEISSAVEATAMLYDELLISDDANKSFMERINKDSVTRVKAYIEQSVASAQPKDKFQFVRNGFFCVDTDSCNGNLIFNKTDELKSGFKPQKQQT